MERGCRILVKIVTLLLLAATLSALFVMPAMAQHYSRTIVDGDRYTLMVGDTMELYNPESNSGMRWSDYYWGVKKDQSTGEVELTDNNRYGNLVAKKAGTVVIYAELYGSYPITKYGERYNSAKKRWESYSYVVYQSKQFLRYATITILDDNPPTVAALPDRVIAAKNKTVKVALDATTGTGTALKYQWYCANQGTSKFTKSSMKTATYSTTMTDAVDGRKVYCVVTDGNGKSTKSETVTLQMAAPLKITAQPKAGSAAPGANAKTTVKATGEGTLKYQWYYKNPGQSGFTKSSVTSKTYSATMTPSISGRKVYCVITDAYGQKVTTKTVTLKMNDDLGIYTQPKATKAVVGEKASVSVKAAGSGKLKYTWYVKDVGEKNFVKSSITKSTYAITMTEARNGRQVYCVVSDSTGAKVKSKTVTLTAIPKLKITAQPTGAMAAAGSKATVKVKVTGGSGVKYQWYLADADSKQFSKSSITKATYSTTMDASRNGRRVYCVITDAYGQKVTTKTVTLKMAAPIQITQQPAAVTVFEGQKASVSVKATGEGKLKYQWYIKNPGSEKFAKSSLTDPTYTTNMKASLDGRELYCVITDAYGQKVTSETVRLNMVHKLTILQEPLDGGYYDEYEIHVDGTGDLTFTWYSRTKWATEFSVEKVDVRTGPGIYDYYWSYVDFSFDHGRALRGGQLYCVVTDTYGQSVTSRMVNIAQ